MKTYRKEILKTGSWKHPSAPGGILTVTQDYLSKIVDNFKYSPFAPVLRGHVENIEAEKNPDLTISKNIKGLNIEGDSLYAEFEVEEKELDKYNDVSVSIDPDYINKETGKIIGPMLKHVAMVLNPYIKGMGSFTALSENDNYFILLSEITDMAKSKDITETVKLEEVTEETKVEETKVEEVAEDSGAKPEVQDTPSEVVGKAEDDVVDKVEETEETVESGADDEKEDKEEVQASDEVQNRILKLEQQLKDANLKLQEKEAEESYKTLLSEGKLVPSQKVSYMKIHSAMKGEIELSEGVKEDMSVVLSEFFKDAPRAVLTETKIIEVSDEPSGEEKSIKEQIRSLPVHAKKTGDEFDAYWKANKETLITGFKKNNLI